MDSPADKMERQLQMICRLPERCQYPFVGFYMTPRLSNKFPYRLAAELILIHHKGEKRPCSFIFIMTEILKY